MNSVPINPIRSRCLLICMFVIMLSLTSCAKPTETETITLNPLPKPRIVLPTDTPEPTATLPIPTPTATPWPYEGNTPAPVILSEFEEGINPLTGLKVTEPSLLERRPVMVKVSNWPRSGRPHAGLSSADIVFEYYIGYQMNRFLAIYYGKDADIIGPVRSGRLVDAKLVDLYQGLLAYGDADPGVDKVLVEKLGERALAFGFVPCPAMCGGATHDATGVFANSGAISTYADEEGISNQKPDLRGMVFQPEVPTGDEPGSKLSFMYADFSVMQWRYNPTSGLYDLWQDAESEDGRIILAPTVDRNTDQQLAFSNVLILFANYFQYTSSLHDIDMLVGNRYQSALLFRDGKLIYGTWHAPYNTQPLIFETPDGSLLPLKPGNTWIVLAGNHTLTQRVGVGEWDFSFDLP